MDAALLPTENTCTFMLAGNARFTVVSTKTGTRFTFRVRAAKGEDDNRHFVSVLTGSDNNGDFTYLGTIFNGDTYSHGRRSDIGFDAPSARAARWALPRLLKGEGHAQMEVWHEGRCGRCARALTVPESIASGFGPECIHKI